MHVEKLPNGRWAVCEGDGAILQTWKTERCARFDLLCYLNSAGDRSSAKYWPKAAEPEQDDQIPSKLHGFF